MVQPLPLLMTSTIRSLAAVGVVVPATGVGVRVGNGVPGAGVVVRVGLAVGPKGVAVGVPGVEGDVGVGTAPTHAPFGVGLVPVQFASLTQLKPSKSPPLHAIPVDTQAAPLHWALFRHEKPCRLMGGDIEASLPARHTFCVPMHATPALQLVVGSQASPAKAPPMQVQVVASALHVLPPQVPPAQSHTRTSARSVPWQIP
jgi:hypothetical protein